MAIGSFKYVQYELGGPGVQADTETMENYWNIPLNTTCSEYFGSASYNLVGFTLYYAVSQCLRFQNKDNMDGGRGVEEFLRAVAKEYFDSAKEIIVLYDESWEIDDLLEKLEKTTLKSLVTYFLPLDPELSRKLGSKAFDDPRHKRLLKGMALFVFVKNDHSFSNLLALMRRYPWFNKRARTVVMVKEKGGQPGRDILNTMDVEKIFNSVVVTEVAIRDSQQGQADVLDAEGIMEHEGNQVGLQVAALDPYPLPGQPKQVFVARWVNSQLTNTMRPIFHEQIDNLRGHRLRAIVFEFPPLVFWEQETPKRYGYRGLEVKIFDELSKYINFTYEIYELKGTQRYGVDLGNGEWSGLIGEVADGKADIGFANVFLLDGREKVVDVTTPYDIDRGCFAVPRPESLQHWLGLILPFSWQVWACIISMALIAGPIFSVITRPLGMDETLSVGRGIFYALGAMVSSQRSPKAKSSSLRSFIVSWLLFCWLSCILYRVALISSLTVGPADYKVDSLDSLVRSGLRWSGVEEIVRTFSNTTNKREKRLFKRFQPKEDQGRALDRVANKGDFAVMDSSKYLHFVSKSVYFDGYSSQIHITKECPSFYNVGFILPIGSPFLERFNHLIHMMQNGGFIKQWLEEINYRALLKNPSKKRAVRRERGLSIGHLKLCFILGAGGFFFASLAFIFEQLRHLYETKKFAKLNPKKRLRKLKRKSLFAPLRKDSGCSIASSTFTMSSGRSVPSVVITTEPEEDTKED